MVKKDLSLKGVSNMYDILIALAFIVMVFSPVIVATISRRNSKEDI